MVAAARSKPHAAAEDIIEPYLIRYGFLQFALRGRLTTGHGLSSFDLTLPEPSLAPSAARAF
jgi:Holliday junction resolvasome RuvABC ATP-dependent DNA helicase subunit